MSKHYAKTEGIEWKQMDVRKMEEIPSYSIDVTFDKGTLDAMIYGSEWDPPDEVCENTGQYMREVRPSHLSIKVVLLYLLMISYFESLNRKPPSSMLHIGNHTLSSPF
jgi:hypothetical protein